MSIFSKLLEAINLGHQAKASPAKRENTNHVAIEKSRLDEIPVFTKQVDSSVEQGMERQLRTRKFGIHFELTPEMRAIIQPEIAKNVSLIKDIPSQYFTEVEGLVMRSVAVGGDLKTLTDELHKLCGITLNRAGEIALDQNKKVNAVMNRTRQLELGLTKAIWIHTQGGCAVKRTHPTTAEVHMSEAHEAFSGQTYDIAEGALIDGKRVWPGSESGCCCMSKSVMPDFMK